VLPRGLPLPSLIAQQVSLLRCPHAASSYLFRISVVCIHGLCPPAHTSDARNDSSTFWLLLILGADTGSGFQSCDGVGLTRLESRWVVSVMVM
jgi:hypothetical protein